MFSKIYVAALAMMVAVCVGVITYETPLSADDIGYSLMWTSGRGAADASVEWSSLSCLKRLSAIEKAHVYGETARFADAIPLRLSAGLHPSVRSIVNGLMVVFFLYFFWRVTGLSSKNALGVLSTVLFVAFTSETVVWAAGFVNYLWPATLLMAAACVFCADRSAKPISKKEFCCWLTMPVWFVLAGGHEIYSVPICFALLVYWIREIVKEKKIVLNFRFVMSVGFVLGTFVMFLLPASPLFRAGAAVKASTSYKLLCCLATGVYCFVLNPFAAASAIALPCMAVKGKLRPSLTPRCYWLVMIWLPLLALTLCFGNLSYRCAWPFSVVSLLLFFVLLREMNVRVPAAMRKSLVFLSFCLSVFMLGNTLYAARVNRHRHERSTAELMERKDGVYVMRERSDWLFGFLFDRSCAASRVKRAQGVPWVNGTFSASLGYPFVFGLDERDACAFYGNGPAASDLILGEWSAPENCDILISNALDGRKAGDSKWRTVYTRVAEKDKLKCVKRIVKSNFDLYRADRAWFSFPLWTFVRKTASDVYQALGGPARLSPEVTVERGEELVRILYLNRFVRRSEIVGIE